MTKDKTSSDAVQQAVEALKIQAAPVELKEPPALAAYYAFFDCPVIWKPGIRAPEETPVAGGKTGSRFKRSLGRI